MNRQSLLLFVGALASSAGMAADRQIAVPAKVAMSWGYVTGSTLVKPSRTMGVGFWQRASGAKPGVGEVFVSEMEYQLPEAPATRLRSASFQFSGTPSQCVGNEPVVVDVYAYAGDGKGDVADTTVGSKIATLSADCTDRAAFSRPIDVTRIVQQTTVASGIRFVGFNVRRANNRQGPGLFALTAGKLTVVIADQDINARAAAQGHRAAVAGQAPVTVAQAAPPMQQRMALRADAARRDPPALAAATQKKPAASGAAATLMRNQPK